MALLIAAIGYLKDYNNKRSITRSECVIHGEGEKENECFGISVVRNEDTLMGWLNETQDGENDENAQCTCLP